MPIQCRKHLWQSLEEVCQATSSNSAITSYAIEGESVSLRISPPLLLGPVQRETERERDIERQRQRETHTESYSLQTELNNIRHPHPQLYLSREQKGYQKSYSGGDHYLAVCLGQKCVSLPE